jgi:hypothetical protein
MEIHLPTERDKDAWQVAILSGIERKECSELLGWYGLPASLKIRTAWWD